MPTEVSVRTDRVRRVLHRHGRALHREVPRWHARLPRRVLVEQERQRVRNGLQCVPCTFGGWQRELRRNPMRHQLQRWFQGVWQGLHRERQLLHDGRVPDRGHLHRQWAVRVRREPKAVRRILYCSRSVLHICRVCGRLQLLGQHESVHVRHGLQGLQRRVHFKQPMLHEQRLRRQPTVSEPSVPVRATVHR